MKWKDIAGYEGYYMVSDTGLVKSLGREVPSVRHGKEVMLSIRGRVLKPLREVNGPLYVNLYMDGNACHKKIHILVAEAFLKKRKKEQVLVRHIDGNPGNNNVSNLAFGTHKENSADAIRHGTVGRGEICKNSILTNDDVVQIRTHVFNGVSFEELSIKYGVCVSRIAGISHGRYWKHVGGPIIPPRKYNKLKPEDKEIARQLLLDGATLKCVMKKFSISMGQASALNQARKII